jgi:hypothetical protein
MTTIIKKTDSFSNEPAGSTPQVAQVVSQIDNYWGSAALERFYPISLTEVIAMFAASTATPPSIAIRISNKNNPQIVKVSWEVYHESESNGQNGGTLPDDSSDDTLFILDKDEFDSWGDGLNGYNALTARLAKSPMGNVYVFIHHTTVEFKAGGGTGGGDNNSAGVKIPS